MSGPFVVKRVRQCGYCDGSGSAPYVPGMEHDTCLRCEGEPVSVLSVKAVADLSDARTVAEHAVGRALRVSAVESGWFLAVENVREIGRDGDTVPLPDGGEIRVEATTWERLASDVEIAAGDRPPDERERDVILRLWNAKHGVGGEARG